MSWLTNIVSSWKLSQKLPEWGICIALGAALMLPLVCGKTTFLKSTTVTEYRDTTLVDLDSLLALLKAPRIIYRETVRTIVLDSGDTLSSDVAYTEDSTDYPPDSAIIAKVESIRDEIADMPIPAFGPSRFGASVDVYFGASVFHGSVLGAMARVWFGVWSLFFQPRLVLPDWKASSVDGGISWQVF